MSTGEMFYSTDGKGRWYRKWIDSDGVEHKQRLMPEEEARLQARYESQLHGKETDIKLVEIPDDTFDKRVRDAMGRVMTQQIQEKNIQQKKDFASLEDAKRSRGGGVVPLSQPSAKMGEYQYDSPRSAIYDLYARSRKGDKEAESKLDQLWKLSVPLLKRMEKMRDPLIITECPKCGAGIDPEVGDCPVCGWSMYEKGYSKSFDEIVTGRER